MTSHLVRYAATMAILIGTITDGGAGGGRSPADVRLAICRS